MEKTKRQFLLFSLLLFGSALVSQTNLEIWQIQGKEAAGIYSGKQVRSSDNIVTLVSGDGFFMQTPPARSDGDVLSSDGIFVYTGSRPFLDPGDRVTVQGTIEENQSLTRFSEGAVVTRLGSGAVLPEPVHLDSQFPAKIPQAVPQLERLEGMRVSFFGYASGPSNRFGECPLTIAGERPFREPGLPWPGRPGLPVWDGNPEIVWCRIPGADQTIGHRVATGAGIQATGVLTFAFGRYMLLPEVFGIDPSTELETPSVRAARSEEFTVASLNTRRLMRSDVLYQIRLRKLAGFIVSRMRAPDVVALQELGDEGALEDLIVQIKRVDPSLEYSGYFRDSNDGINTAFLCSSRILVESITQFGTRERLSLGGNLHDRPPLLLRARLGAGGPSFQVLNLHLRSQLGINGADSSFVRQKRYEQALSVARLVQERQDSNLIVAGDFNALPFSDGYVDVHSIISGELSLGALLPPGAPLVSPALSNLTNDVPLPERYSFLFDGSAELLDHCLVVNGLKGFLPSGLEFARGNVDASELLEGDANTLLRASDHDAWVLYLQLDKMVGLSRPAQPVNIQFLGPNPLRAGQSFSLKVEAREDLWVEWFGSDGRRYAQERHPGGFLSLSVPNQLAPGMYWLSIRLGNQISGRRVVVGN